MIESSASKAWMLGPKAENQDQFEKLLLETLRDCCYWRKNFHAEDQPFLSFEDLKSTSFQQEQDFLRDELQKLLARLRSGVPFFSPRYVGHMLTDQYMAGFLGYAAASFHNQNTLVQELAPVTLEFEGEALQLLGEMLGLDLRESWGHLCSGGTTANIEGLWVARNVRLFPYLLKKAVDESEQSVKDFLNAVPVAPGRTFGDYSAGGLSRISVDDIILLHKNLKKSLSVGNEGELGGQELKLKAARAVQEWSPAKIGLAECLRRLGTDCPRFRLIIGKNAHYSLLKATGLLGFGEDDVIKIESVYDDPFDQTRMPMRMDLTDLKQALDQCDKENACVLAVIGVFGSTEIAAIDPIADIVTIRNERRKSGKSDFWLHGDACYGGYVATMLRGRHKPPLSLEDFLTRINKQTGSMISQEKQQIQSLERRIARHTIALSQCDSISIDPHKLGYIPYPAGAILFKQRDVRELIKYEAPYLNAARHDSSDIPEQIQADERSTRILSESPEEIEREKPIKHRIPWYEGEMSSYTLEGSRPGAAAASVYLAHRTVPLDQQGHGTVIGQTILGTWKLIDRLKSRIRLLSNQEGFGVSFLNPEPDLNIVCYNFHGKFQSPSSQELSILPLYVVNEVIRRLYQEFLPTPSHPMPTREFVIAKTALTYSKYGKENLTTIWKRLSRQAGIDRPLGQFFQQSDIAEKGNPWRDDSEIVLIRTAIMGIFFLTASTNNQGKLIDLADYYADTIYAAILRITRDVLNSPLPPERKPQLKKNVIIVEDDPKDRSALMDQFRLQFTIDRGKAELVEACSAHDATNASKKFEPKCALVDVALGGAVFGGIDFLESIYKENWFSGAILFTSLNIDNIKDRLATLVQKFQNEKKTLILHQKPSAGSKYYQTKVNRLLADLWDIIR